MKEYNPFKSRKFIVTMIMTAIFLISIWLFNLDATNVASALGILYAPYLMANVAAGFNHKAKGSAIKQVEEDLSA